MSEPAGDFEAVGSGSTSSNSSNWANISPRNLIWLVFIALVLVGLALTSGTFVGQTRSGLADLAWPGPDATSLLRGQLPGSGLSRSWCPYGTLPGTWVSKQDGGAGAPRRKEEEQEDVYGGTEGTHWQPYEEGCQLRPLLSAYAASGTRNSELGQIGGGTNQTVAGRQRSSSSEKNGIVTVLDPSSSPLSFQGGGSTPVGSPTSSGTATAVGGKDASESLPLPELSLPDPPGPPPVANIMFISDSVDRHIMTALCEYSGGEIRAIVLRDSVSNSSGGNEDDACSSNLPEPSVHQPGGRLLTLMTAANYPSCIVNTCSTPRTNRRLRLLASYIPGVHPSGPYHKGRKLGFRRRIDQAATVWHAYASGPPDIIIISSTLWDLARLSAFQPDIMKKEELPRDYLESWVDNYTRVVEYTRLRVNAPDAMFVYHTNMMPRYDSASGDMIKAYLGRANHIRQLNSAGRHAASLLGMEVVDYEAVAARFLEGQTYLVDMIHPNPQVGLELANIYLNYISQIKRGGSSRRGRVETNNKGSRETEEEFETRRSLRAGKSRP